MSITNLLLNNLLVINVWTTEPKRKSQSRRGTLPPPSSATMSSNSPQMNSNVQKFGNQKPTTSAVGLGAHEGKYTPSASVPDLATRFASLGVGGEHAYQSGGMVRKSTPVSSSSFTYLNYFTDSSYQTENVSLF